MYICMSLCVHAQTYAFRTALHINTTNGEKKSLDDFQTSHVTVWDIQ